ncbi:hypothetical protein [Legionella brunensis]|uniref:Uncharacterized protein n=1 Tax=Legionella brunensis TaxID=29422 RepID=A0A0W0S0F4_9GAMM|nr:hypothetical protein [Legionella brunensis]KTC76924.1 hypothetical protein Lbru_3031 [Legionella brunensis]
MKGKLFTPRQSIPFQEYFEITLMQAKRIVTNSRGKQCYSGAQFEIALISFGDLDALKKEMDPKVTVDFSNVILECDWLAGFDWLDLSVGYGDKDAIKYFEKKLQDQSFYKAYILYKQECRPDCALQDHEHEAKKPKL